MWISYSDSEVNKFHPICEEALNNAIKILGKETQYMVVHHQYTGTLEMDFVIQNIKTKKYLCVIEVKRTPPDIHSTRHQFQAMSYVQMNAGESEKPFYILTNLEYAISFRYDAKRPRVFQQILKPGLFAIGRFNEDSKCIFIDKLANYFSERIAEYCIDKYEYFITLEQFANHIETIKENPQRWKSDIAVLFYEYIRGAFTFIKRNELPDVRLFKNNVARICNEASRVNFKEIFSYSKEKYEECSDIDNAALINLYDFGHQNITGDSVAGLLHQIVSSGHEHEGEVPTDLELGRIVAELAYYVSGGIKENEFLCDPAAGSGNLISSSINTFMLNARQIIANDWNPRLLELLSLRLGLNYARTVRSDNSPMVTNENIVMLSRDYFKDVKVIVMNPPFVAGINCVERKQLLYSRIKQITGYDSLTNIGQMPLEAIFLELVSLLVKPGTTIACVFPKTHLLARGIEAKVIRKIILENLGLKVVFTYPGNSIFNEVTKDTCVLVGNAMEYSDNIDILSSYDNIPDLDIHRFKESIKLELGSDFHSIMPGIVAKTVPTEQLRTSIDNGWRELNSEMAEAISFVRVNFEESSSFIRLKSTGFPIKRGPAGTSGGSDMIFFKTKDDIFTQFEGNVTLAAGVRNATSDTFSINNNNLEFFDCTINDELIVDQVIEAFMNLPTRDRKQQQHKKDMESWKKILKKESKGIFAENSVLIPRGIRTNGRIYISKKPIFVSTNFVVCTLPNYNNALLLSTWMATVFYQLICETSSKDQEGMRKMEVQDIIETLIPDFNHIPSSMIDQLESIKSELTFLDLKNPTIRDVDKIWANFLFNDKANYFLENSFRLLSFLANRRNPG